MTDPDRPPGDADRLARATLLAIDEVRDELHHLAAQVVALVEVVGRRIGEPIADEVEAAAAHVLEHVEQAIERAGGSARLQLGAVTDKYALPEEDGPPCAELVALCEARCCRLPFALTSQDLDEGAIRWDHARPYLIRQTGGRCTHLDAGARACGVYAQRPATCRQYDCRADSRVWVDYARRIPAPWSALLDDPRPISPSALVERVRARRLAVAAESIALRGAADREP